MADNEKKIGVPIDDDALDGVTGGIGTDGMVQIENLNPSGGSSGSRNRFDTSITRDLTPRGGSIGTMEPLNSDAENTAEEFRQGINLGNMLGRY